MLDAAFPVMAKMKGLRGTALDIFGRSDERKMERGLIAEYEAGLDKVSGRAVGREAAPGDPDRGGPAGYPRLRPHQGGLGEGRQGRRGQALEDVEGGGGGGGGAAA